MGYLGGLCFYAVTSPVIFVLAGILLIFLALVDWIVGSNIASIGVSNRFMFFRVFAIASSIGLVFICWLMARIFLTRAQRWVADRDRTRHWYDEPLYRRSRSDGSAPRVTY